MKALLVLLALGVANAALLQYQCRLDAKQSAIAVVSDAWGWGNVDYDDVANIVTVRANYSGLGSAYTASHLHYGVPGVNGPVAVTLSNLATDSFNGMSYYSGVAPANMAQYLAGFNVYVNIHSSTYTNGEIRCQLYPATGRYSALLDSVQSGTGSPAYGSAYGTLSGNTFSFTVYWYNMQNGAAATVAHIHKGRAGVAGGIVYTFAPAPPTSPYTGSMTVDDTQMEELRGGLWYFNVHSALYPAGEIRGQIYMATGYYGSGIQGMWTPTGSSNNCAPIRDAGAITGYAQTCFDFQSDGASVIVNRAEYATTDVLCRNPVIAARQQYRYAVAGVNQLYPNHDLLRIDGYGGQVAPLQPAILPLVAQECPCITAPTVHTSSDYSSCNNMTCPSFFNPEFISMWAGTTSQNQSASYPNPALAVQARFDQHLLLTKASSTNGCPNYASGYTANFNVHVDSYTGAGCTGSVSSGNGGSGNCAVQTSDGTTVYVRAFCASNAESSSWTFGVFQASDTTCANTPLFGLSGAGTTCVDISASGPSFKINCAGSPAAHLVASTSIILAAFAFVFVSKQAL